MYVIVAILVGIITLNQQSFSQDKFLGESHQQNNLLFDAQKNLVDHIQPVQHSAEYMSLVQQMKDAKASGNVSLIQDLQHQLDVTSGETVSKKLTHSDGGTVTYVGQQLPAGDNIVNTNIFPNPSTTNIKAMATGIEQRGTNPGRIWVVFAYGSTSASSPDTLRTYYSDNGGYSWTWALVAVPGGNAKFNNDEIDFEIMEYTTGQKYLWIVMGATASTGQKYSQLLIEQTPTFAAGYYNLSWPGATTQDYYMPRITSDNANYSTGASYSFIISGRDSVVSGSHIIGEKFTYCSSPFSTTPTMTYRGACYFYNVNYGSSPQYDNVDIAYYRNGGDSMIVTESNLPTVNYVYCMKDAEVPTSPSAFASLDWGQPTYAKQYARVVSNGASPLIMIAARQNYMNNGDWDIIYMRSLAGGIPATSWTNGYIDAYTSTTTVPWQPDLYCLRNTSSIKCSYVYFNTGIDSAMNVNYGLTGWGTITRVNNTGQDVSISASSHAGYRFVNADSCFTVWSNYPATNVWAATGCTGTVITGNHNNHEIIPEKYSLEQNYPNPFNPTTDIKFSIPQTGLVKLVVYDILGQEVATLVNEVRQTGNYSINFNASNLASGVYIYKLTAGTYVSTKKLTLIK